MDTGKWLAIIGGIITFAGTWWLSLLAFGVNNFAYAVGGIMNFNNIIQFGGTILLVDNWIIYLLIAVYCFYLISFIIQLLGGRSRVSAFLGSLLPLALGVLIIIASLSPGFFPKILDTMALFSGPEVISKWFPFHYELEGIGIGTFAITFGSLLAFISTFIPRHHEH